MNFLTIVALLLLIPFVGFAQNSTIKVNPDGTHTIVHRNGNTSTKVNPDGTHTVIHHNGNKSKEVAPDETIDNKKLRRLKRKMEKRKWS